MLMILSRSLSDHSFSTWIKNLASKAWRCVSFTCVYGVQPPPWKISTWPLSRTLAATSSVRWPLNQSSIATILSK